MNLLPVLERLRAECPALTLEAPTAVLPRERELYPVAQVVLGRESAEGSERLDTGVLQILACEVHVYVSAEAARVQADYDPLAEALADVRAALIGYQHSDWDAPLVLSGGEVVSVDAGAVLWRDTYFTRRHLSASITAT